MNSRGMKILLSAVMLVAVITAAVSIIQRAALTAEIRRLSDMNTATQASWQNTATAKEALEAERDDLTAQLREAQVSLSESTEKNEALTRQIAELKQTIADDQEAALQASAELETLSEAKATAAQLLSALQTARETGNGTEAAEAAWEAFASKWLITEP